MTIIVRLLGVAVLLLAGAFGAAGPCQASEKVALAEITGNERCPVCGMFVAKYPGWVAQIRLSDNRVEMFDGPKDMLVYYFSPKEYGAGEATVADIVVRDYYTQKWIDGRSALYVIGSDVYGPMGSEFVPFETREAAENFVKDHRGKQILSFTQLDDELVQSMRKGHKMMGGKKK